MFYLEDMQKIKYEIFPSINRLTYCLITNFNLDAEIIYLNVILKPICCPDIIK